MDTCENCGRPVLPTDVTCWHCGYALPRRPKPVEDKPKGSTTTAGRWRGRRAGEEDVAGTGDYNLQAIAVYGVLTLLIILALGLVMRALGQFPILVRSASLELGGDWVAVTDADLQYTLSLPDGWQWLDLAYRDQTSVLDQVLRRQAYIDRALQPLGRAAGDVAIIAVAVDTLNLEDTEPKPFVVVGRSERLHDVTPQEALDSLAGSSLPVTDQFIDRRLAGQPQARFNVLDAEQAYQCRHLFVVDTPSPAYLVAGCAPQAGFATLQRELDDILDSFQLLQP